VREAIVFVEEAARSAPLTSQSVDEMFAEMEPYTVQVGGAEDSRQGIYSRMPGE
jgi:hypothetical protein